MKQTIIDLINSNTDYKERALDTICKDKLYVVVDNDKIVSLNRTIFGAEFTIKNDSEYYYDFELNENVKIESPLQIIEISAFEIGA